LYYAVVLGLPILLLDADATSQSAYDWFKVAKNDGDHKEAAGAETASRGHNGRTY
jgi:hypothetical protein